MDETRETKMSSSHTRLNWKTKIQSVAILFNRSYMKLGLQRQCDIDGISLAKRLVVQVYRDCMVLWKKGGFSTFQLNFNFLVAMLYSMYRFTVYPIIYPTSTKALFFSIGQNKYDKIPWHKTHGNYWNMKQNMSLTLYL